MKYEDFFMHLFIIVAFIAVVILVVFLIVAVGAVLYHYVTDIPLEIADGCK